MATKSRPSQAKRSKKYTAVEQQSQKRPIFLVVNGLIGDIFHNKQLSYQHKQVQPFLFRNGVFTGYFLQQTTYL
jgi:hypothetical protein